MSYGGDKDNKHITTYFRKTFTVVDQASVDSVILRLLRDDGAVVYINGTEVARDRMGTGPVDYQTLSPEGPVGGAAEDTFYEFTISPAVLTAGPNVMAVEIHQQALNSSDISFDAELTGMSAGDTFAADGDADGMPDGWEVDHFGSTEAGLPGIDSDGDGVLNGDEAVAGTVPTDDTSFFRIEQVDASGLSWTAVAGRTYSIDWTDDLGQPFVQIASGLTVGSYAVSPQPGASANYYCIRVELE